MESATSTLIVLEGLHADSPVGLHGLQVFLAPHTELLILGWWVVAGAVVCRVMWLLVREYR